MKRKLLLPAFFLSFAILACSLVAPRRVEVTPTLLSAPTSAVTKTIPEIATPTATTSAAQTTQATATTAAPADQTATPSSPSNNTNSAGPMVEIKGTFQYSNDFIFTYYVEDAVALTDMYGFVKRDKKWVIPVSSQFLGYAKIDREKKTGTFDLNLPALPTGKQVNVNPNGKDDQGVQIYAMVYSPNLTGGPYAEGDDPEKGWPTYLASVKTDTANKDEVTGGQLVIWSPDNQQSFPSSFGADGLLFTQDDPVMKVPEGYSIIDLDQKPFKVIRGAQEQMTLYEPKDAAIKDFSKLSYKDAFDQMFAMVRKEYAFNGIDGKQPNWDKVYADLSPRVDQADQKKDPEAYYLALRDFTLAFKDGHVGLQGDIASKMYSQQYAGGYGFAVRQLDDGKVIVVYVLPGGPAEKAGMKTGAEVSQFNGKPIDEAIRSVVLPSPESMDSSVLYEQARYLVRAPIGTKATVTFTNSGGSAQTVQLSTVQEQDTLSATSPYRGYNPDALPVEFFVTQSGIGYVSINSNNDDLNLVVRLFQRALNTFKKDNVQTIVIDMRVNFGGAPLGLAGFLTNQEITLGQLQYYSEKTGKFEANGLPDTFPPFEEQYKFNKMFLLVGQGCASACELEAYGFSKVPGMVVVGEYPTSGTEAEVARGQFKMPEGLSLQIPTGRFILPDGSIFLEGKGVQPTERIPIDENTVKMLINNQDPVTQKVLQLAAGK